MACCENCRNRNCCCNHRGFVKTSNRILNGYLTMTGPALVRANRATCSGAVFDMNPVSFPAPTNYNPTILPQYPDPANPTNPRYMEINGVSTLLPAVSPGNFFGDSGFAVYRFIANIDVSWTVGTTKIPNAAAPDPIATGDHDWFRSWSIDKVASTCSAGFPATSFVDTINTPSISTFSYLDNEMLKFTVTMKVTERHDPFVTRTVLKNVIELDIPTPWWPTVQSGVVAVDLLDIASSSQTPYFTDLWNAFRFFDLHYAFSLHNINKF